MQYLGIHLDPPYLRMCLIEKSHKSMTICLLQSIPLKLKDSLFFARFQGKIASGLSPADLLMFSTQLKTPYTKDTDKALRFHIKATSYFPPQTYLSEHLIQQKMPFVKALTFSVDRKELAAHKKTLDELQIDPDFLSSYALALVQFIRSRAPQVSDAIIIHLGSSEWICVCMHLQKLEKAHALRPGVEELFNALKEDRKKNLRIEEIQGIAKHIDLLQLKESLNPCLTEKLQYMAKQLTKVVLSFDLQKRKKPIIFTGLVSSFGNLSEFLQKALEQEGFEKLELALPFQEKEEAVSVGLSLEAYTPSLQLLKEEFFPKKNWAKIGQYCCLFVCITTLFSSALFWCGQRAFALREEQMLFFLNSTLKKWGSVCPDAVCLKNVEKKAHLEEWITSLTGNKKLYRYILQAPTVTEVLTWLDEQTKQLELTSVEYELEKYPSLRTPQSPYSAKVCIECACQDSMRARLFHERLLQSPMIETKAPVVWEAHPGGFFCSFFLKNREFHVF